MKALKELTNEDLVKQYDNPASKYSLKDMEDEMAMRFMMYYRHGDVPEYDTRN